MGVSGGLCDKQPGPSPRRAAGTRRHFPRADPRRLLCHAPQKESPAPVMRLLNYNVAMPVSLISVKRSFCKRNLWLMDPSQAFGFGLAFLFCFYSNPTGPLCFALPRLK